MQQLLIQPLRTEKTTSLSGSGWYAFQVNTDSNKQNIKKAIEKQFNVHVTEVKTVMLRGKTSHRGRKRLLIKTSDYKKALVKLKKGETIALFGTETKS